MTIQELLLKYRKPLFAPEGEGGGAAPAPAADGGGTALGGDGGADTAPAAGDDTAPAAGEDTAPAAEGDDTAPADGDDTAEGADGADAAEFKLDVPEGMENFQGDFEAFSSEASQWMADNPDATPADALKWAADRQAKAVADQTSEMSKAFEQQIDTWEKEARADKEIGGDSFDANLAVGLKALEAFGSDGLKSVLNESGLGSHPEMIKFAIKAGKALQDSPVITPNAQPGRKSMAEAVYGKKD